MSSSLGCVSKLTRTPHDSRLFVSFAGGSVVPAVCNVPTFERLHKDYARARAEFKAALMEVVAFHQPGPPHVVEAECAKLLSHFR